MEQTEQRFFQLIQNIIQAGERLQEVNEDTNNLFMIIEENIDIDKEMLEDISQISNQRNIWTNLLYESVQEMAKHKKYLSFLKSGICGYCGKSFVFLRKHYANKKSNCYAKYCEDHGGEEPEDVVSTPIKSEEIEDCKEIVSSMDNLELSSPTITEHTEDKGNLVKLVNQIKHFLTLKYEENEQEYTPVCCGKHCSETDGLKLGFGWNKYNLSKSEMITEQLYCEECYLEYTHSNCKACGNKYLYTEMKYKDGDGFGESLYGHNDFFCKDCVQDIDAKENIKEYEIFINDDFSFSSANR